MAQRTVHIPDDLDRRVVAASTVEDSYSGIVQEALELWLREHAEHRTATDHAGTVSGQQG